VGDSGFLILRRTHAPSTAASPGARGTLGIATREPCSLSATGFEVCFRSPQQLRSFNAPFQLGLAPEPPSTATRTVSRSAFGGLPEQRREEKRREEKRRAAARCRDAWFETPHDASLVRVPIKADDLVVLATDGLFDNMPESEVLRVVAQHAEDSEEQMAAALAERARELSLLHDVDSPFAILAKDNDIMWGGGRPDDITVLVSRVVECAEEAPPPDFPAFTGPGKVDEALAKALAKVEAATPFEADPEFDWD
jgi:protein phosphatase PTC7